jgi:hypothetical protein
MADLNKFEEMLERLVNEDKAGAEELFHEIVVEKSRDIYESLLEDEEVDETTDEEVDEASDEEVDEATDEEVDESDDEDLDENFDLDEFEVEADDEADPMADMGGDMGDDMAADMGDEMGDEEGEGDVEDRVEDLEDALDELKAEFEKMMSGDDGEEGDDMDMDADDAEMDDEADEAYAFEATDEEVDEAADEEVDEAADEEVDEAADEEVDEADKSEAETMREYVEKVSATMGDNGANTKSAVAGKNDMGGTAGNLNQAGAEAGVEANKGNLKGSALSDQNPKDMATGNVNVPGGKASKSMKAQPKGHGAEKKQSGGETGTNGTKSVIGQ